jgi:hypothetical protein
MLLLLNGLLVLELLDGGLLAKTGLPWVLKNAAIDVAF